MNQGSDGGDLVVSGFGIVTPAGESPIELLRLVHLGVPVGFSPVNVPGVSSHPERLVGRVIDPDPEEFLSDRKNLKYMDHLARLAVRAAGLALRDAGLEGRLVDPDRVGVYMGIGFVASELKDLKPVIVAGRDPGGGYDPALLGGRCRINPVSVFRSLPNIPACNVSIALGLKGENSVTYPDSVQTGLAIEEGADALLEGRCDVALVGGAFHAVNFLTLQTLGLIGRFPISTADSTTRRSGGDTRGSHVFPPADGAAVLVLERGGTTRERGGRPRARLHGFTFAAGFPETSSRDQADEGRVPNLHGVPSITCEDDLESYALPVQERTVREALTDILSVGERDSVSSIPALATGGDDGHSGSRETLGRVLEQLLPGANRLDTRPVRGDSISANLPVDMILGLTAAEPGQTVIIPAVGLAGDVVVARLSRL